MLAWRRFGRDRRGYMLALGAILMPLVILVSMLAIDLGMRMMIGAKLSTVATLAAESGETRLPDAGQAEETARSVAWSMLTDVTGKVDVLDVAVASSEEAVTVSLSAEIRTIFAGLFGHQMTRFTVSAERPTSE